MTVLSMKMIRADGSQKPFDGTCTDRQIKDISFNKLLGIEFVARSREDDLLPISQELFELLARAENDKAAAQALDAIKSLMLKGSDRSDQELFFDWLDSVYWELPLYIAHSDEDANCNSSFWITAELPEIKKLVVDCVAGLWAGKDDELGMKAISFLRDSMNFHKLRTRGPKLMEAVRKVEDRHHRVYGPASLHDYNYPREERNSILAAIKSALPSKPNVIAAWIRRLREENPQPKELLDLFSHAYVKAGGDVLAAA